MRRSRILLLCLLVVFTANHAFAQQTATPRSDSYKYRTGLTIAGAAGGFAAGFLVGRAAYDTPNSHRQVWTAAAISAGIGGAGGYLIGWAIDNRRNRSRISVGSDNFYLTPLVSNDTKGLRLSIGF